MIKFCVMGSYVYSAWEYEPCPIAQRFSDVNVVLFVVYFNLGVQLHEGWEDLVRGGCVECSDGDTGGALIDWVVKVGYL